MGFDLARFDRAQFKSRTREVKVPEMKAWFGKDDEPVFVVRGLVGEELYRVREAVTKRKDWQEIGSKLASVSGAAIAEAIEATLGDMPDEQIRHAQTIRHGCVDPALDLEQVNKLIKNYPVTATTIALEILKLTGEGADPGESSGSGGTPEPATT